MIGHRYHKVINGLVIDDRHSGCIVRSVFDRLLELSQDNRPYSLKQFALIFQAAGDPPAHLNTIPFDLLALRDPDSAATADYAVPSLEELGMYLRSSPVPLPTRAVSHRRLYSARTRCG